MLIVLFGIVLASFLVGLDRTVIATAIPRITDDFDSPGDVGWYASAYLISVCVVQPIYGQIYSRFDIRWTYILAFVIFEVGSLICGIAKSSTMLIVGRGIGGMGCAGILVGGLVIITVSVEISRRPVMIVLVGSMEALSATYFDAQSCPFSKFTNVKYLLDLELPPLLAQ